MASGLSASGCLGLPPPSPPRGHLRQTTPRRSGVLFLPPSPPAEKATTSQDQAGKASTGDGAGNVREGAVERARFEVTDAELI